MTETEFDKTFHALAHVIRRKIIDIVKANPGCNIGFVCKFLDPSRIAVMNHLKVLTEAKLILSEKVGRERRLYLNTVPIQVIFDRWSTEYSAFWASQLADLKYNLESDKETKKDEGRRKTGQ